ncbi:MAG: glycoside hydrolase family 3 C-terminal domain-containing protein [Victivallaceae bacterium]|nr:glycoside hydrolase family 3 C-terminal domain-containing protein [Victivallaceae bacterium]
MKSNRELAALVAAMTLDEKISLCHGNGNYGSHAVERLGIPSVRFTNGPRGVRLEDGQLATAFPCTTSLASTFDRDDAFLYGEAIGRENLAAGFDIQEGPGMNMMRSPLCGRNFEYMGEDPVLTGEMASAYVDGCQKAGTATTAKHFALNNQEACRRVTSANVDERTMREYYLRAFEIVVAKSNPWMIMGSYNRINGVFAAEDRHLLSDILRDEWKYDGVVVSDWGAVQSPYRAAIAGTDLDMNGGDGAKFNRPLKSLVERGLLPESVIDEKVMRWLRLLDRLGMLSGPRDRTRGELNTKRHHDICRKVAQDGMVLLKNEGGLLPLDKTKLRRIAVVGPSADPAHAIGPPYSCGGSSAAHPEHEITPLAGLREYLGDDVEISYAPGELFQFATVIPEECLRTADGRTGLDVEYFSNHSELDDPDAASLFRDIDTRLDHQWSSKLFRLVGKDDKSAQLEDLAFGARWTGFLVPRKTCRARISVGMENDSRITIELDGKVAIDTHAKGYQKGATGWDFEVESGKPVPIRIEMRRFCGTAIRGIRVNYVEDAEAQRREAVELAAKADAVIYFGGTNHFYDKEAIGATSYAEGDMPFEMPGTQDELIATLAAANPKLVVCLIGGSVMDISRWVDKVPCLMHCWYMGMEAGRAVSEVLFGDAQPGGRLCCTWGRRLDDYACHALGLFPGELDPYIASSDYLEGVFVGYRYFDKTGARPLFPFGFGLGYTTFSQEVSEISVDGRGVAARVRVTNTGNRRGSQVIQLYVGDDESSEERPQKELEDFAKVELEPGESRDVELRLEERDFMFFSGKRNLFVFESGKFTLYFSTSERDCFDRRTIELK